MRNKPKMLSSYTEEELQSIYNDYVNGMSKKDLCNKYDITENQMITLQRTKKWKRDNPNKHPYVVQAVQDHINGMLLKHVCDKYKISNSVIYRYMKLHGIEYKNEHGRKYICDKNYFHTIDTEHKAYWLGFIFGDGNVAKVSAHDTRPCRLCINISSTDREILEKFNEDINSTYLIQDYIPKGSYAENPMSRLSICSVDLCHDLVSHGCVPNKTRQLSFPYNSMNEKLYRHFIRGLYDADGYFGKLGNIFCITKYIPFLVQINEILLDQIDVLGNIQTYKNRATEIGDLKYYKKEDIMKIYDYLYTNSTIYLERKYIKANLALTKSRTIPSTH